MSKSVAKQVTKGTFNWVTMVLCLIVAALAAVIVILMLRPAKVVSNFEQCKAVGGAVLESYPEQCLIRGTTFTNSAQHVGGDDYVGLSETEALAKAKQANVPARVVERDGESLPITMDFAFGRHNLYVKDGKVYKVEIEGQATDTMR